MSNISKTESAEQVRPTIKAVVRPRIVCLCGSTRFYEAFQRHNYLETMAGKIVLSVGLYRPSPESEAELTRYQHHGESIGCTPEQKVALDNLHKDKIDLADEVLILNVGGYVGTSTRGEIYHAAITGKAIRWLEGGTCPMCDGRGGWDSAEDSHRCVYCAGRGEIKADGANPCGQTPPARVGAS